MAEESQVKMQTNAAHDLFILNDLPREYSDCAVSWHSTCSKP